MASSFRFLIRDGLQCDIPACLGLESAYETDHVWQMSIQPNTHQIDIAFRTERLPRAMAVDYPISKHRLRQALPRAQCFLVAVGQEVDGDRESEMLGFLVMRHDPSHQMVYVQDIVVSRPFRRRRIGSRLLKAARQWAIEHDAWQLTLEIQTKNYPAIQFCQKSGLTFCGFNDQYFPNQDIAIFFGQILR